MTIEINSRKLQSLRAQKQVKQPEVEDAVGIPHGRLTQYECGRANPSIEHLDKLANYYGVPARDLMSKKGINRLSDTSKLILSLLGREVALA